MLNYFTLFTDKNQLSEPMVGIEPTTYSFAYTSISPEKVYKRTRLYFHPSAKWRIRIPLSVVRAPATPRSCPFKMDINRYSGFIPALPSGWAGSCDLPWSCSATELHRQHINQYITHLFIVIINRHNAILTLFSISS